MENKQLNLNELSEKIDNLMLLHEQEKQKLQLQIKALNFDVRKIEYFQRSTIRYKIRNFFTPRIGKLEGHPPKVLHFPSTYYQVDRLAVEPKITIVTPSFNQGEFIERTIMSVLNQDYENLEYIIQDGGSTDNTVDILKSFDSKLTYWQSQPDKGQTNAINLGFRHATGEILAYLNSDDILLPGTLNYVAAYFNKHPNVDVVYGHRILVNEDDKEVGRWILPKHCDKAITYADFIPQETLFWRKRIWDKIGGRLDENFNFAMDWDLILRLRDAGAKFVRLPRFLGGFRVHSKQKTFVQMDENGLREMDILRERCLGRIAKEREIRRALLFYLIRHCLCQKAYRFGLVKY